MAVSTGTAILGTAAIGAVGSAIQGNQARKAAKRANKQAIGSQNQLFEMLRADSDRNFQFQQEQQAPFRELSLNALKKLMAFNEDPSQVLNDPLSQELTAFGTRALENSAAARGRLNTNETRRNVVQNALRNIALPLMNNRFNQLATTAGFGRGPAPQINNLPAANVGTNIANLMGNAGTIDAQAGANNANLLNSTLNNLVLANQVMGRRGTV